MKYDNSVRPCQTNKLPSKCSYIKRPTSTSSIRVRSEGHWHDCHAGTHHGSTVRQHYDIARSCGHDLHPHSDTHSDVYGCYQVHHDHNPRTNKQWRSEQQHSLKSCIRWGCPATIIVVPWSSECVNLFQSVIQQMQKGFLSPLSPKTLNAEATLQSVRDRHLKLVSACSKLAVPHAEWHPSSQSECVAYRQVQTEVGQLWGTIQRSTTSETWTNKGDS